MFHLHAEIERTVAALVVARMRDDMEGMAALIEPYMRGVRPIGGPLCLIGALVETLATVSAASVPEGVDVAEALERALRRARA